MNGLEYARKYVTFNENSPIFGAFNDAKYPFVRRPLLSLDNIAIKRHTIYKASQTLGTQVLLCATAYRLHIKQKTVYAIAQTDDTAESWGKRKVRPFLARIRPIKEGVRSSNRECVPITNTLWQFPNHFLLISGPGLSAQNSIDTCYLHMDEGHLYVPGTFAAFEDRMGGRWDRSELDVTTAADAGHEADQHFHEGDQAEWHNRCTHCQRLFWPLWVGPDMEYYGKRLFHWRDGATLTETLDSLRLICPHCDSDMEDDEETRFFSCREGDYVCQNPSALAMYASTRWNCFAPHWRLWRDRLATYLAAIESVKLGDTRPHENWIKKHECRSYTGEIPDVGNLGVARTFALGEIKAEPDTLLQLTVDYQAGKGTEGKHMWCLVTQWDRMGNSRRIAWRRQVSWSDVKAMQDEFKIDCRNVYIDCGFEPRTVFQQCALYRWYACRGSDSATFTHMIRRPGKEPLQLPNMPYSQAQGEDGNIGTSRAGTKLKHTVGKLPPGWAAVITMANPTMYGYLHALYTGAAGREFEMPEMPQSYRDSFPAFMPRTEQHKKTRVESEYWQQIKPIEHAWDCEVMALMGAMRAGFYPLADVQRMTPAVAEAALIASA